MPASKPAASGNGAFTSHENRQRSQRASFASSKCKSADEHCAICRSDFFQGDRGAAGLPAFPQLRPDTLAEYVSKNPHLFQPAEAAQTSSVQVMVCSQAMIYTRQKGRPVPVRTVCYTRNGSIPLSDIGKSKVQQMKTFLHEGHALQSLCPQMPIHSACCILLRLQILKAWTM